MTEAEEKICIQAEAELKEDIYQLFRKESDSKLKMLIENRVGCAMEDLFAAKESLTNPLLSIDDRIIDAENYIDGALRSLRGAK